MVVPYGHSCYAKSSKVTEIPTASMLLSLCDRLREIHATSIYTYAMVYFEFFPCEAFMNAAGKEDMAYAGRTEGITVATLVERPSKVETGTEEAAKELQGARETSQTLAAAGGLGHGFGKVPVYGNYCECEMALFVIGH